MEYESVSKTEESDLLVINTS